MSSENYIQDVEYPSFYNGVLNPLALWFTAAVNGYADRPMPESFRYCDLGCGNGTTLIYLASMFPQAHFVGVDFNADHIAAAKTLAEKVQLTNIEFHQLDFADLEDWDTEAFDFAVCFGAFSWINIELQNHILGFVGNKLTRGGLFLVHYAAKPGKVQIDPLWHLMRTVTETESGNSIHRVREGIKVISQLQDKNSRFFQDNPVADHRAKALGNQDLNYVAHESLTEWQAFFHSEIAQRAGEQGLTFAGPSGQSNVPLQYRIPQAFKALFSDSQDTVIRETLCDYIHNTGVRTDVFVKDAPEKASNLEVLDDTAFGIMLLLTETIPAKANALSGQGINLNDAIPKAILGGVAERSMTFREMASLPALGKRNKSEVQDMLAFLVSTGAIQPLAGHYKPIPANGQSRWEPILPLTGNELASEFPLSRALNLPSAHTGQCTPLPPLVALVLATLQNDIPVNRVAEVAADKVVRAGNELFPNTPNPPKRPDLVKSINDQLPLVIEKVLPRLVSMGVYGAAL
jgi:SAM-dependent methyltransferase